MATETAPDRYLELETEELLMKKIVLTFGLLAGGVLVAMMAITLPFLLNGKMDSGVSEIVGYSSMVLAFVLVFFGIRTYRENAGAGTITFGKAVQVGLLITLIASACYVVAWEIIYFNFLPDFADKYAAMSLEKMTRNGASAAEIAAATKQMDEFKVMYKNPLFNVGMTFMEVFPVGLLITLISAAILRRKSAPAAGLDRVTA